MKKLILLIVVLMSTQIVAQKNSTQISATFGEYFYYTPKNVANGHATSITTGMNFSGKYFVGIGMDICVPYFDEYLYNGLFVEGKFMLPQGNVSPYVSMRYGIGFENLSSVSKNYISPGIGLIQHLENLDIQFSFNYKSHDHSELQWVRGTEVRIGVILNL